MVAARRHASAERSRRSWGATWCGAPRLASRESPLSCGLTMTQPSDPVLAAYRKSIDNFDAALIHILAERFRITQAVGAYKAEANLPPADPGREAAQIQRLRSLAEEAQLDPEFSEKFIRFVIDE